MNLGTRLNKEKKSMEIVNAKIISTTFGIEDHGIMTFFLHLEWSGCGQGLGGYALDKSQRGSDERIGFAPGFVAIRKILETVGVETWEDLKGQLVRLKIDSLGSSRRPIIGNILEDKWFDLKEFVESQRT